VFVNPAFDSSTDFTDSNQPIYMKFQVKLTTRLIWVAWVTVGYSSPTLPKLHCREKQFL